MKFMKAGVCALAFFLAAPIWATTIWGGFEDTTGHSADYDYNDLVFSISGNNLALKTANNDGVWFGTSGLVLGTSGTPFWNNASLDAQKDNVGYCMYGGGTCNGGVALDANGAYLATAGRDSVNDVYFSVNGGVDTQIVLKISADNDSLGYELLNDPTHTIHSITSGVAFTPGGNFELVGRVAGGGTYLSDDGRGVSQFAFFETPEPATTGLLGLGLFGGALFMRKRSRAAKN
ncbi:MAG TPA: PEP-CTERM sorting domain-containing protein [Bryobacteraceae bacterium]|nr:PEP-CTERM sorting domain-containing protein [Bryobacteraceae bacterium]